IRENTLFNVLDPCAIDPYRDVVLLLARNRTGMTADALAVIDDKSVVHSSRFYHEPRGLLTQKTQIAGKSVILRLCDCSLRFSSWAWFLWPQPMSPFQTG